MKKVLGICMVMLMALVVGCSSDNSGDGEKIKIGIIQIVDHESLDAARNGFIDKLKAEGYEDGKNIEIDYQNAQGDQANLKTIASKLAKDSDLILAIATPSAQAVAAETDEVPVMITAVTDPLDAGLVKSLENPGTNVSGTTDAVDVAKQVELIKSLKDVKTVGLVYNASEANSKIQIDEAKKAIEAAGMKTVEATVASTNDIKQAMTSIAKKADAVYVPTDNTVASGMVSVGEIAKENNLPVITASTEQAANGGLASYGVDYAKLGEQTAEMALKVIKDNKDVSTIPVEGSKEFTLFVNEEMAKSIGIDPDSLKVK